MSGLAKQFYPQAISLTFPADDVVIAAVQKELAAKAKTDTNKCWGYFPGMSKNPTIDAQLPHSQELVATVPSLQAEGKDLKFNFVRLSLVQQTGDAPYHLDSDAATALTGNVSTIASRLVWRLLINLSDKHPRTLSYLDLDAQLVDLDINDGYIHCPARYATPEVIKLAVIPPRKGQQVSGVLFCASRVLHTGKDDEFGHFVTGYGCEE